MVSELKEFLLGRKISLLLFLLLLLPPRVYPRPSHTWLLKTKQFITLTEDIFPCKYPNMKLLFTTTNSRAGFRKRKLKNILLRHLKGIISRFSKLLNQPSLNYRALNCAVSLSLRKVNNYFSFFQCLQYFVLGEWAFFREDDQEEEGK
jgi:hypothetical protein